MTMGKHKVKDRIAYFFLVLVVLSIFQAVVIVQPAMRQCIEPAQKQECSPPQTIETIFNDNLQHHLGNDFKEDLTPKEPEGVIFEVVLSISILSIIY